MTFQEPLWFALVLVIPVLFFLRRKGYLGFSSNKLLGPNPSWINVIAALPKLFLTSSLVLLVVALARPQIPGEPIPRKIPGRDIILAVDISFSMSFPFKGELTEPDTPDGLKFQGKLNDRRRVYKGLKFEQPKEGYQRIHASQNALLQFIADRYKRDTGDRIGILLFDVQPRYGWPITDDLRMLYRKAQFVTNNLGTGTNFGKNPPGPIDLAAYHFNEYGEADSRVLIMVTDGEDDMDPGVKRRLARIITENKMKFYLVGIGETLAKQDVGIIQLAQEVGGKIYRVEDTDSLNRCFAEIDRLEKSEVTISQLETRDDVFFYFAWTALGCLGLFLLTEAFILRR